MAKKRKKRASSSDDADSLGELMDLYYVSLGAALIVAAGTALVGMGMIVYALTREPVFWVILGLGGFVVLVALLLVFNALRNVGRRFELRKKGIRFIERGDETEMLWSDIADVQVDRTDETYMGPVSKTTRSSDAVSRSGPLTTTEWNVTIYSHDGDTIHLTSTFLQLVPNVQKLISRLKLRAGI